MQVVESLRLGRSPAKASHEAVRRIMKFYPSYVGAVIAVDANGKHAAAAAGWIFEYAARSSSSNSTQIFKVQPMIETDISAVQK